MDPFGDSPAVAPDPEFQEMPAGLPFYPDWENILEYHGLIFTFPPLINLDLKITDLRVRGIEDAAPVQLRYLHQRDIDQVPTSTR